MNLFYIVQIFNGNANLPISGWRFCMFSIYKKMLMSDVFFWEQPIYRYNLISIAKILGPPGIIDIGDLSICANLLYFSG